MMDTPCRQHGRFQHAGTETQGAETRREGSCRRASAIRSSGTGKLRRRTIGGDRDRSRTQCPAQAYADPHGRGCGRARIHARPQEGSTEYWYRRILINPGVVLHTATEAVPAYATRVSDEGTITVVAELYRNKYGTDHPVPGQVPGEDSEATTVRFEPL